MVFAPSARKNKRLFAHIFLYNSVLKADGIVMEQNLYLFDLFPKSFIKIHY